MFNTGTDILGLQYGFKTSESSVPPIPPVYAFKRAITIDKGQVLGSHSNFPVLISGTYSYLKTVANGGNVIDPNGYDIGFFSDLALTIKLPWDIELYNAVTGEVIYWVNCPAVTDVVNPVIYLAYGAVTITTDQSDTPGTYDSNYLLVQHLPNGTVLSAVDSTSNANDGTINGAFADSGQIDGAANFSGGQNIDFGSPGSLSITGKITLSCWANLNSLPGFIYTFIQKGSEEYRMRLYFDGDYNLQIGSYDGSNHEATFICNGVFNPGDWNYIVGTYDGTAWNIHFNGVLENSQLDVIGAFAGGGNCYLGQADFGRFLDGLIDEARISDTDRSRQWITTEYNNQFSPGTFYSVGPVI